MNVIFDIDLTGLSGLFTRAQSEIENGWSAPLQAVAEDISEGIQGQFATEGYGKWDAPSPLTLMLRKQDIADGKPLIDTGDYLTALSATAPGVPDSLYSLSAPGPKQTLTMGYRGPKADNQNARTLNGNKVPARPVYLLPEGVKKQAIERLDDDFAARMSRAQNG